MRIWQLLKSRVKLPPAGLVFQLFVIILLPLTLLLVAITFGSISIHNTSMRTLVGERDQRTVNLAASALSLQIDERLQELANLGQLLSANPALPVTTNLERLTPDFDAGVAVFDLQGKLDAARGDETFWTTWMKDQATWRNIFSSLAGSSGKLLVISYPLNGGELGLISEPVGQSQMIVGSFSIASLVENTVTQLISPGGQLSVLLVGSNHQILFSMGSLSDQSANHPGVSEALQGQSGTKYVRVGTDEHVTAYSPVTATGWALVTEESWEAVVTPALRASLIAPLVLVPAVVILLLALYLGATQVVRPLSQLESQARTLSNGDFKTIQEPVGGIAEIQHLQMELIRMADKVRAAQRSLHGYIGAITSAQEDERRRLARELHDDTLQALIALKQRVQLAQLETQPASRSVTPQLVDLDEIANLTDQTIENLHRVTRALRPVYLEDLGLVPALEMLARQSSEPGGSEIVFHCVGTEKRLDPSVELALYRMAQEALANIARHAHAGHASVKVTYLPESVTVQVEDDGVGFRAPSSPSEYAASGHYGLLGLHERAELIGAKLEIRSSPGQCTSVIVTLPV